MLFNPLQEVSVVIVIFQNDSFLFKMCETMSDANDYQIIEIDSSEHSTNKGKYSIKLNEMRAYC